MRREAVSIRNLLGRHKLATILLAAALTVAALILLVQLPDAPEGVTVTEQNGVYDLTEVGDLAGLGAELAPGPSYYPGQLLTPETVDAAKAVDAALLDAVRADFLSQRFFVRVPEGDGVYTLTFRVSGRHAMRVYVNGLPAGEAGRVGTTKADTEIWENNMTVSAAPKDGKMDIILQSAQFYHARSGANLASLTVRDASQSVRPGLSSVISGFLVMGVLLCAAALLLGIYLLLLRTRATLWFAMACFVMALRECIQSQAWTYFPINGSLSFMLEYMSVVLLTVFLCLYLTPYAQTPLLRGARWLALAGSGAYGVLLLTADSVFYTRILGIYQVLLIAAIVPGIGGLFWQLRRPNREQTAALYGIGVFYLAALADILRSSHLLGPGGPTLSETAMLVFVLAQTVSLFLMNNRVLAEAKAAKQKLAVENAALEDLNRMKTEFWSNASHEMRTPLTVVSVNVQTVEEMLEEEAGKNVAAAELLRNAQEEIMRLTRMVGGMLTLSFLREKTDKQAVDLSALLRSSADIFSLHLQKRGNLLKSEIADGLTVFGNADLLAQVAANLLQNAAAYTEQGVITLQAHQTGHEVLVQVRDTGSGISAELLPRVFERGVSTGGTGFGLYLCKTVVESHGGRIWLESVPGGGTLAAFVLPTYEGQLGGEKHA